MCRVRKTPVGMVLSTMMPLSFPDKVQALKDNGIIVDSTIPTGVFLTRHNSHYLQAKKDKKHHLIDLIK